MSSIKPPNRPIQKTVVREMLTSKKNTTVDNKSNIVQMSYYLTRDHVKAIAMKSGECGEDGRMLTKSQIVRDAIEYYLKDEFEYIQKKKNN